MKRVLMVAYHYPPSAGGSGVLRTLKYSRYLPEYGWQPLVLTAHARAYERTGSEQLGEVPPDLVVTRAFALNSGRHLAVRGATLRAFMLPDRWASWWLGAVPAGLRLIRRHRPEVIWSTYPIATAHLIGLTLHRVTGLPWVADFRDSMTEEDYPTHALTRRLFLRIERQTAGRAARLVFTAASTRRMYLDRYPGLAPERCLVIPNGYDEDDFLGLPSRRGAGSRGPLRLLHAGVVYPEERDPRAFFHVLSRLKRAGALSAHDLRIDFRATGTEDYYARILAELEIADLVHLLPPLPYREGLADADATDGLLVLQGASCNHQIPAKVYEYFRLGKPILALTAHEGDTAALLREVGGSTILDLHGEAEMAAGLGPFLAALREGRHPVPDSTRARRYARRSLTGELAAALDEVGSEARRPPAAAHAA